MPHENSAPVSDPGAWYSRYTDLVGYASSLDWEFEGGGKIDFVPAGKQGPVYSSRVTTFDWPEFYSKLGGGVLLEALKVWMRDEYDYVLIDSRTGVSDTSGICTVQMPDDLVICYTLNRQSMVGAAAAARSAFEQRRKPNGEPGLRVWPVSHRIELGESDRLASVRITAQQLFQSFIGHLPRKSRQYYWGQTEVQYQPYYAYEEVLAVFKDLRRQTKTLLADLESVIRTILNTTIELGPMADDKRAEGLTRFIGDSAVQGKGPSASPPGYLSTTPTMTSNASMNWSRNSPSNSVQPRSFTIQTFCGPETIGDKNWRKPINKLRSLSQSSVPTATRLLSPTRISSCKQ